MLGMSLREFKAGFFDRAKVKGSMDKATVRSLSKFGAFVRQRARTSIRTRKAVSQPESPPSSHTGLLKKLILFARDGIRNVVIGVAWLNGTVSATALRALEKGGESLILRKGKKVSVFVRRRPFMAPAFNAEIGNAPRLWQNAMR